MDNISIEIDYEIYNAIKNNAIIFEDTSPCDVIRRWANILGYLPLKMKTEIDNPIRLNNSYINKRIKTVRFSGKVLKPRDFSEMQVLICQELLSLYSESFDRCLSIKGPRMKYFAIKSTELKSPKGIGNSEYFVETKLHNDSKVLRLKELMRLLGHDPSDLKIEVW